jgi:hypothetical protein
MVAALGSKNAHFCAVEFEGKGVPLRLCERKATFTVPVWGVSARTYHKSKNYSLICKIITG